MTGRDWLKEALQALDDMERFELELLLCERLQMSRAHLLAHLDDALSEDVLVQLAVDQKRLAQHVPLQYVLGHAYFMDACYYVNENVLIPRFDTEYLVQAVLDRVAAQQARVLDLCTGSGIVAISLARARQTWRLFASDLSDAALAVARKNGVDLGVCVDWRRGDLFAPWKNERFDVIVANPPYIAEDEYRGLSPDVHREPRMALVADHSGLIFYERLTKEAPAHLCVGGWLAVEIGWQQGDAVRALFTNENFKEVECLKDGQGHDRVVVGHL